MTEPKGRRRPPISAVEFMAQLERDDAYQQRIATAEAERSHQVEEARTAEAPIVADLAAADVRVPSVWALVNTDEPYPEALPILMRHLQRGGYPDGVMQSLGRALAVKPAAVYWDELRRLYLAPRSAAEEDGVAVALAASATSANVSELVEFLSLTERGQSRIYFLRPILKLGGSAGRDVVEGLRRDAVFSREANALLSKGS